MREPECPSPPGRGRPQAPRWARRLYERLLGRFLGSFSDAERAELLQVFSDQYADVRARSGRTGLAAMWLRVGWDLVRSAIGELVGRGGSRVSRRSAAHTREGMTMTTMTDGFRDARLAARSLSRDLAFTLTAVVILGVGIGANTTVFTLVSTLFLSEPPEVVEPDRLVRLNRTTDGSGFGSLAYPDYAYYRDNNDVFDGVMAYDPSGFAVSIDAAGRLTTGRGWMVSDNYFDVLGTRPAAGRWFMAEEDRTPGTHTVAVLSHALASTLFGGANEAVGRTLSLNGNPFSVVGVAPPAFRGTSPTESPPDVWVPIHAQPVLTPLGGDFALRRVPNNVWVWLWAVGRLRDGVTVDAAQSRMEARARYLEENFAEWNEGWGIVLSPGSRFHPPERASLTTTTALLFGLVGIVLVIACANLAILLLARGSTKLRDVGVRLALGASRARVVRSLLTESLLLALAAGALGVAVTFWTSGAVARLFPTDFVIDFEPDVRVMSFALLLATATTVLFGLLPAWQVARSDVQTSLKGVEHAPARMRGRNLLVVAQVALSVMLVSGAGLCVKSLAAARGLELGFETEDRLLVSVNLSNHGYTEEEGRAFISRALERLDAAPDVRAASTMRMIPFRGRWSTTIAPPGTTEPDAERVELGLNAVSPGYFDVMSIPVLAGRTFTSSDAGDAGPGVAIVNRAMAERYWPEGNPVGRVFGREEDRDGWTVVGVVENAHLYELGENPPLHAYLPVQQRYASDVTFLIDTGGSAAAAGQGQAAIQQIDPSVAFASVRTMREVADSVYGRYRVAAVAVGLFGLLALLLACAGLYGVLSYMVARRRQEIGVRVALGASAGRVGRAVLGRGVGLAAVGAVLGVIGAVSGSTVLASFLYDVSPRDPVALLAAPLLLVAVAAVASLVPARRATGVSAVEVLKAE